jgi:hypothetical protein
MPKTEVGRARLAIRKLNKEIKQINEGRTSNIGYIESSAVSPVRALTKFIGDRKNDKSADKKIKTLLRKAERLQESLGEEFQGRMQR